MKNAIILIYSILSYLIGMIVILGYAIWLSELSFLNFLSIDLGLSLLGTFVVNSMLLLGFALQHSMMARKSFKKKYALIFPKSTIRSTYILISSIVLLSIMLLWQEFGLILFEAENLLLIPGIKFIYWFGWVLVVLSTFQIDHFHFFGIKQAWQNFTTRSLSNGEFKLPFLYRIVRHPLYLGLLFIHWFTPLMSSGRLFLAIGMTIYIYFGISLEEQDLVEEFGEKYKAYKKVVPKLLPIKWLRFFYKTDN